MKRRLALLLLALLLLLTVTPALAQNYSFSDIHAAVDTVIKLLPVGVSYSYNTGIIWAFLLL